MKNPKLAIKPSQNWQELSLVNQRVKLLPVMLPR